MIGFTQLKGYGNYSVWYDVRLEYVDIKITDSIFTIRIDKHGIKFSSEEEMIMPTGFEFTMSEIELVCINEALTMWNDFKISHAKSLGVKYR